MTGIHPLPVSEEDIAAGTAELAETYDWRYSVDKRTRSVHAIRPADRDLAVCGKSPMWWARERGERGWLGGAPDEQARLTELPRCKACMRAIRGIVRRQLVQEWERKRAHQIWVAPPRTPPPPTAPPPTNPPATGDGPPHADKWSDWVPIGWVVE